MKETTRTSPEPLYLQIRDTLRQRILDGTYPPHERLPSESEFMKLFGVSRITVRQALRQLHAEGLIFSAQGKGTFVSKPKAVQKVEQLQGFEEAMQASGYETSARLVSIQRCRPFQAVQAALSLNPGEDTIEVKRVRYLNREPVSVDLSYFPTEIGDRLLGRDLTHDIFTLLENELGVALGAADIKLGATLADDEIHQLLHLQVGDPVLRVERLTFDAGNRPLDFEYLFIRGDAYQYQFRVERK